MGLLRSYARFWPAIIVALVLELGACGGHTPPGISNVPGRITLTPGTSASLQLGNFLPFTAIVQNGSGTNIGAPITFASSDTSVLTLSPAGTACAGTWNAPFYTVCSPGGVGVAQVTASALGVTSAPTFVYVHPPIDNIQVNYLPPVNSPPPACPTQQALPAACNIPFNTSNCTGNGNSYSCKCFSQNQVATLQAKALSQGADITDSVGPFTWSEAAPSVVRVTPLIDPSTGLATSQATATPTTPGQTQVFASASGVSSQAYNFETCPVQCIALNLGTMGSNQTNFILNKGAAETVVAAAVDVQGCIVPKPPLTWSSSEPAAIPAGGASTGCPAGTTCALGTTQPGAAAITASCTPPTCNLGFPLNPANLSPPFIPMPVYPVTPISGVVNGATVATSVLGTTLDCVSTPSCTTVIYSISTSSNLVQNGIQLPAPPNSLIIDPTGTKAYMGSQFGASVITVANLGGASNAFQLIPAAGTPTGLVTGKAIAASGNGNTAIFSDTISQLNQVYVVTTSAGPTATPLNISKATTAAFSPDGLKAFISGTDSLGNSKLFVYSALQSLQTLTAPPANAITFSSNGSFAFVSEGTPGSAGTLAVYNVCDNSQAMNIPLPITPLLLRTIPPTNLPISVSNLNGPNVLLGVDNTGLDIIVTTMNAAPLSALCPQTALLPASFTLGAASISQNPYHINIGQGSFQPINFFLSPNGTQLYIVASDQSKILVYSFDTGAVSAIPLANSILGQPVFPVSADMTVDGTLLYVATSDGTLHEISATLPGSDLLQLPFAPLPNSNSGFCVNNGSQICQLNLVAVKP